MFRIETLLTFQNEAYIDPQKVHTWTTRSLSSEPSLEIARLGTGRRWSIYGAAIHTSSTCVFGETASPLRGTVLWPPDQDRCVEAKSSRPTKTYAWAGQSAGGDSRHLFKTYTTNPNFVRNCQS